MQEFWIRVASTLMIVLVLLGYNITLDARSKDEEIARLNFMVDSAQSETESAVTGYKDGNYTGEAEVDSISGATFSSNGIKEAVGQALDKAVG